jgi:hypothetical protein
MPFGLTNAPATFCTMMNEVFQEYLDKFVVVYLDDIVIYSSTLEEHVEHLKKVFAKLREHKLFVKLEKCSFAQEKIKFLGHIIQQGCIRMDQDKVKAIEEWQPPSNVSELRSFLGLANYYRRFVKGYSKIASPLTELLKKGRIYNWSEECQRAFMELKEAMSKDPVLALPDIGKPFEIQTDASDYALSGVLLQDGHPIAYESRKLNQAERNYAAHEKELLAVVHCLRTWRHYILGSRFVVKTDNTAVSHVLTQPKLSSRQARWQEKLAEFDFALEYKAGATNHVADALSRKAELAVCHQVCSLTSINNSLWDKIKANLDKDTMAVNLIDLVKKGKTRQFWLQDGLLMSKGNRVFVPKAGDLRRTLLRECHDTLWAGHPGEERTLALLKQGYYWPQMCDDVVEYVRTCLICQQDKPEHKKKAGLLEPLPVPKRPWESVSLDYITSLPKVGDIGTIVTMVDRFSKYATFVAAPKYISAEETAQLFFKHIVKYWGVPKSLVSDRDSRFMGNFWTELFKLLGTSLDMSSSYHPESDGQTERFNYMRQEYLRHFVNANQKNWVELLDVAQLCFNSQRSSSTGKSPFEIVTGQQPLLPHTVEGPYEGKSPRAFQFAREWKRNHDLVRAYLEKAASKMKKWADEHRRPLEFKAGDQVLVKLKSDERKYLRGRDKRLVRKYEGPVTIIKKIGKCAYKIDAPSWLKVHPVFHVSLLKPYNPDKEDPSRNESQRQPITVKAGKKSVECILADRVKKVSRKQQRQYLVKWKGLGDDEISWEREADLTAFKEEIEAYWAKLPRTSTVQVGEGVTGHP